MMIKRHLSLPAEAPETYQELARLYVPRKIHDKIGQQNATEVVDRLRPGSLKANAASPSNTPGISERGSKWIRNCFSSSNEMSKRTGTVIAVSGNQGSLVVANDEGWTVVELLGSEGEISVGDTVFGDWDAVAGEDLIFNDQKFDAYFQGTGSKEWALGLIARWGGS